LEGDGAVLEELLLPAVEEGRMDAVLVTQVRHRLLLQEMQAQDGHLLRSRVMLALLFHGIILRGECSRFLERRQIPIHAEPLQRYPSIERASKDILTIASLMSLFPGVHQEMLEERIELSVRLLSWRVLLPVGHPHALRLTEQSVDGN